MNAATKSRAEWRAFLTDLVDFVLSVGFLLLSLVTFIVGKPTEAIFLFLVVWFWDWRKRQ